MKGREAEQREYGTQRLDALLHRWELSNHDLVLASGELAQLTHKQVQRARRGRRLNLRMMQKVTSALNAAVVGKAVAGAGLYAYVHRDLFSYAKGYNPAWQDPNEAFYPGHE